MKILVTSKSFGLYAPEAVKLLEEKGFLVERIKEKPTAENIAKVIYDYEAIIVGNDTINKSVIDVAKKLKLIHMHGTGLDAIDKEYANSKGIVVCNAPGANKNAVAELTVALMLMAGRKISSHIELLKMGKWDRVAGNELSYKTVGMLGIGNIGKRVVELIKGFSCNIIAFDLCPDLEWVKKNNVVMKDKESVFKYSDYLIVTLPLTEDTKEIVNKKTISLMKTSSYIINTSRGKLIDENALCDAIELKKISGAAIDAFTVEPLPLDSRLRMENITITPHLAATSIETTGNVSNIVAKNIVDILL